MILSTRLSNKTGEKFFSEKESCSEVLKVRIVFMVRTKSSPLPCIQRKHSAALPGYVPNHGEVLPGEGSPEGQSCHIVGCGLPFLQNGPNLVCTLAFRAQKGQAFSNGKKDNLA